MHAFSGVFLQAREHVVDDIKYWAQKYRSLYRGLRYIEVR